MDNEDKKVKRRKKVKIFLTILAIGFLLWFVLLMVEYSRVKNDKRPLLCTPMVKDVEDDDEYAKKCYGLGYKYKEYYYTEDDHMSARELVLFFQEFKRGYKK